MRKLVVLVMLALGLLLVTPAVASASTPTLKSLARSLAALRKTEKSQAAAIKSLQSKVASQATTIAGLQTTVANHATTLASAAPVLALAPYVSLDPNAENGVNGPFIVFQGANVNVRSASYEGDLSGTGNLIVGWDDYPTSANRGGANNLVVGDQDNFPSYGCLVAGYRNTVSSRYASVSGGTANTAEGAYASVSGGNSNAAASDDASVAGGNNNLAESLGATISGGTNITLYDTLHNYAWYGGTYHTP